MNTLDEVVTISEAAYMWHKNRVTVVRAIDGGTIPLKARQSGSTWIITIVSLRQRWGAPTFPLNNNYNN